jgi:cell shape-determining protein MreD
VPGKQDTLIAACQVAGISAAGLILPCYLIDLAFDTDFLSILAQAMLAAFACALMVAVWTDYQQ